MENKKNLVILGAFMLFSTIIHSQSTTNLKIQPEKPRPGHTISIIYDPKGSPIEKSPKIYAIIHTYGKLADGSVKGVYPPFYYTNEIELKKSGTHWIGKFIPVDTCAGVVLRFTDEKKYDNNGSSFFPIRLYGEDGKFVNYASAGLALFYESFYVLHEPKIEPKPDPKLIVKLWDEEFNYYPQSKEKFTLAYYSIYKKVDKDKAVELIRKQTAHLEQTLSQSYEDLVFLLNYYNIQYDNPVMLDKFKKLVLLIREKYPTSEYAEFFWKNEILEVEDGAKKAELANKFKERFPNSKHLADLFPDPNSVNALTAVGRYKEVYELDKKNPKTSSDDYNRLAWSIYEQGTDLQLAKEVALKGINLLDTEMQFELSNSVRRPYYTLQEWKYSLYNHRKYIYDTYAAILLKLQENKDALKYATMSYQLFDGQEAEVNERYMQALIVNGKRSEAKLLLQKFVSTGKVTDVMKEMLK